MKPADCCSNSLWFIFIGWNLGLLWLIFGIIWFITLIGIPFGKRAFKIANFIFCPFGKDIVEKPDGVSCYHCFFNFLWMIFGGLIIATVTVIEAVLCCITIIGIPFGLQLFQLAFIALVPFGRRIIELDKKQVEYTDYTAANTSTQPIVVVQPIISIAPNQKYPGKYPPQPKQPQYYYPPPQYTTL